MSVKASLDGIAIFVEGIIKQEPHLDPSIGRLHHVVDDDPASRIAVPHVVLHVEASLGQVGQRQTNDEGLAPVAQQAEAGQARMSSAAGPKMAEPGRREAHECRRNRVRMSGRVPVARPVKTWASQVRADTGNPSGAHSRPGSGIFEIHIVGRFPRSAECSCR